MLYGPVLSLFLLIVDWKVLTGSGILASGSMVAPSSWFGPTNTGRSHKILVLGHTGFLGCQIVSQLEDSNIEYVAASKSTGLDLTSPNAVDQVAKLARGCDAVISTVGAIGTQEDHAINAANSQAAIGAKRAGSVKRFIAIGNDSKVRELSKSVPMLQQYASGKEEAERVIQQEFPGDSHTIIQPNFIYGGDDFSLNPPRVPSDLGQAAEDILGLYPLQAASEALPGVLGMFLAAPVGRERVAAAAINAALGLVRGELSSRNEIILAASKRRPKLSQTTSSTNVESLKQQIYDLGDCQGDPDCLAKAFTTFEEIESLGTRRPATDPLLNGRWDFCFDVEADMGTGVIKDILNGESPMKALFELDDLYMVIENQSNVNIMVSTKVLGGMIPIDLKLTTSITPDPIDTTGTTFLETFEGIELAGQSLPIPTQWQRSRPLEFSYLDETMLIARGNGGEPHYLKRE